MAGSLGKAGVCGKPAPRSQGKALARFRPRRQGASAVAVKAVQNAGQRGANPLRRRHAHHHRDCGPEGLRGRAGTRAFRGDRHGVHARPDLLAEALLDPGRRSRRRGHHRSAGQGHRPRAALSPHGGEKSDEGVPRRAAGHRDLPPSGGRHPRAALRHPDRSHGVRLRRGRLVRNAGAQDHEIGDRQVRALHRLEPPSALQAPARICARRCHAFAGDLSTRSPRSCRRADVRTGSRKRKRRSRTR